MGEDILQEYKDLFPHIKGTIGIEDISDPVQSISKVVIQAYKDNKVVTRKHKKIVSKTIPLTDLFKGVVIYEKETYETWVCLDAVLDTSNP